MVESAFFQDLAVLTTLVGVVAVVFSRLGWPKVLGYILVGVLMSENTWGGSYLVDENSIRTLSQLGVVFLMFGMGLGFSAKEMKKIKSVALPCAVLDVVVMIFLGYTLGMRVFHWGSVASLFLGVAMCDSATTLLAKVIGEMGWSKRPFTKYVLGTSVCEDVICVGAIAVASGVAKGGGMSLGAFGLSLGALAVFFVAVLAFGLVLVPWLLRTVSRRDDVEALVLVMLGCCFFVSYLAWKFEFSLAMGAFLVGLLGAASGAARAKLDALAEPLKAMFSAMFFVTIGLMVNPQALWAHLPAILLVSAVVMLGKFANVFTASLATGLSVKAAVQTAFSLAQIGEFAFMTAILYAGLTHDSRAPLFQIAVGASLLTTLLNPLAIKLSDKAGDKLSRRVPRFVRGALAVYRMRLGKIRSARGSLAYMLAKRAATRLAVYGTLTLAVALVCVQLVHVDYTPFSSAFERHDRWIFFGVANVFVLGLLPLVVLAARALGDEVAEICTGEGNPRKRMAVVRLIRFVVLAAVSALYFMEWTMVMVTLAPNVATALPAVIGVMTCVGAVSWRFFAKAGRAAVLQCRAALAEAD